ncbi:hypothetical protein [Leifsonia poae]|uniref:hypothetical protein n=1 Tax=Leifsonia poae TaxID=110933 RepID=UPI001CBD952E|nr:hypothetical protein [Leifsonia poae]
MAERNRVTPLGDIVAIPLRGAWTGNRGRLHVGHEITRFHTSDLWITCELDFRGRWSEQWLPTRYTYLFFHDEAVSFAAGHRPCAECRRTSYQAYQTSWANSLGEDLPTAAQMNHRLHAERLVAGSHRRRLHIESWPHLPTGAFVLTSEGPALVLDSEVVEWSHDGYGDRHPRPVRGEAIAITPPATLAVLRDGYPVQLGIPRSA